MSKIQKKRGPQSYMKIEDWLFVKEEYKEGEGKTLKTLYEILKVKKGGKFYPTYTGFYHAWEKHRTPKEEVIIEEERCQYEWGIDAQGNLYGPTDAGHDNTVECEFCPNQIRDREEWEKKRM